MARGGLPLWVWIAGGVVLAAAIGGGGVVALAYWQQSENAKKWAPVLAAAELDNGIPTNLLARIAFQESSYEQDIIDGTRSSSAGALGMMQMLPKYFSTVNRPVPFSDQDTVDQVNESAAQLAKLYAQLGTWPLALAGYNAGASAVEKYGGIPPYSQTQNYVAAILADVPAAANA
jgi:peptidoglycan DL-endopeptidase CwlO